MISFVKPAMLVLTGPKHVGKSSVGCALREVLGWKFIDTDALIEEREGLTPHSLYERGRDIFQKAEAEAIASLQIAFNAGEGLIVAAGGGLTDNKVALTALVKNPSVLFIYLELSAAAAWNRIKNAGTLPAFLNVENPQAFHALLHERRAEDYKKLARIVINCENKFPHQIAGEILSQLCVSA
ncbi:MAG: shikimate kinase [Spirochaetaceae bacterium]|jgi:shikimate kinase|nr:shikimate kinase [Spirochaetaceae bacterium]